MMSHSLKKAFGYIIIPGFFLLLIYGVHRLVGSALEQYVFADIYAAAVKGSPDYTYIERKTSDTDQDETKDVVKESEIKAPSVGEQYGIIQCEDIDLKVPLYFGDNKKILELGAGQYVKSAMPGFGKTILAGGHDATYFAPLEKVKIGSIITINTDYGTYTYEVKETQTAKTEDIDACRLDSDKELLVLYTCYPFGEVLRARDERFFIYADKVSGPVIEEDRE